MLKKILKTHAIVNLLFMFTVLTVIAQSFSSLNASPEPDCLSNINLLDKTALERCKSIEEIRKLRGENNRSDVVASVPLLAQLVTILIAFFGASWTYLKDKERQFNENEAQQKKDTQDKERQSNENEAQRKKDTQDKERQSNEKYNNIVMNLGADSVSIRASNASTLLNFLQPDNDEKFLDDILIILPINLKKSICNQPAIQESLTRVLEKAIRLKLDTSKLKTASKHPLETLNLSRTALFRLNFEGLNFSGIGVDIAFAKMRYANLNDAELPGLRGIGACLYKAKISRCHLQKAGLNQSRCRKAQFHGSYLMSATFKEADLRGAEFHQARLQSVHFNGAKLQGADFTKANLAGAYFAGAHLDDLAINSILNAYKNSWKRAYFDKDIKNKLDILDKRKNYPENNIDNK